MRKTTLALVAVIVAAGLLLACGGPEEKKGKFFGKAKELFERGDRAKPRSCSISPAGSNPTSRRR